MTNLQKMLVALNKDLDYHTTVRFRIVGTTDPGERFVRTQRIPPAFLCDGTG